MKTIVILGDLESAKKVDYREEYPGCHVIGCDDTFSEDIDAIYAVDDDIQQKILDSGFCKKGVCNFAYNSRTVAPPEYFGEKDDKVVLLQPMPFVGSKIYTLIHTLESGLDFDTIVLVAKEKIPEEEIASVTNVNIIQR
jgi:hypothetical protein